MTASPDSYILKHAVLEVTNRCNLHCPHCASDSGKARADEMSAEQLCRVISELRELGCERITLLGGELFLHPAWTTIAQHTADCNIRLQIVSNGILINDALRHTLQQFPLECLAISLDGADAQSYQKMRGVDGFDHIMHTMHAFADEADAVSQQTGFSKMLIGAITTLNSENISMLDQFAALFLDTPIIWQVQMVSQGGERFNRKMLLSEAQYHFFVEKMLQYRRTYANRLKIQFTDDFGYCSLRPEFAFTRNWNGCPGGRSIIGIRSNGDVLPCLSLGYEFVVGNLLETPLTRLWHDEKKFWNFRHKESLLTGSCAKCQHGAQCRAGCSGMAMSSSGTLGENHYCMLNWETQRLLSEFFD